MRLLLPVLLLTSANATQAQTAKPLPTTTVARVAYKDVQPLFKAQCVACHSQEMIGTTAVSGGLALDTYAAFRKGVVGAKNAHLIYTPGKAADSELLRRLQTSSPAQLMPKGGPALTGEQIAVVRRWLVAGAPGPTGEANAEAKVAGSLTPALPMPALIASQDVVLPTRLTLTPDMIGKTEAMGQPEAGKTDKTERAGKGAAKRIAVTASPVKTAGKDIASKPPLNYTLSYVLKAGPLPPQTAIAFSPDGKRLAVGGYRAVIIWDTLTGQPVACLGGLAGQVQSLAYRPDGAQLAIGGGIPGVSGEVKVVDAQSLTPINPLLTGHSDVVLCAAWNAAGTQIATASQDKTARLWDWPGGKEKMAFKDHSDAVTRICFAPDGKSVYTASLDHNARRFDCNDGKVLRAFAGHGEGITALALSPKGDALLTSGTEPEIRWWNTNAEGDADRRGGHGAQVNDIAYSRDGKIIVTSGADHTVRVWDAASRNQLRALDGGGDWMYAASVSPDGKLVAGAGADGIARVWETATGRLRLSLLAWPPPNKSMPVEYAAITPEGYYSVSAGWAARLRPQCGPQMTAPTSRVTDWIRGLRQPANVAKGWQSAPLEPARLETPAPIAPFAPTPKPAAASALPKATAAPPASR